MLTKKLNHKRIKPPKVRDKAHLDSIRALPCVICFQDRSDMHRSAHHLKRGKNVSNGASLKAGDNFTVPLCHEHHTGSMDSAHFAPEGEVAWFAKHGIKNAVELAQELYEQSCEYEKQWHIVCNAKEN